MNPAAVLETYQRVGNAELVHTVIGTAGVPWLVDAVLAIELNTPIPNWRQAVYLVDEVARPLDPAWLAHPKLERGEHVFVGRGATQRFAEFFLEHDMRPLPAVAFLISRQLQDAIRGVMLHRQRELARWLAVMEARDTPARTEEVRRVLDHAVSSAHRMRPGEPDEWIDVWVDPCCT